MTYKHYIMKNKKPDSKESYREYCEQYMPESWRCSPEGMKQQYIDVNYKLRYINHLD